MAAYACYDGIVWADGCSCGLEEGEALFSGEEEGFCVGPEDD